MEKHKNSTALQVQPDIKKQEILFVSPALPGNELLEWCERNSEKIEKILNEEVTQYETKFE